MRQYQVQVRMESNKTHKHWGWKHVEQGSAVEQCLAIATKAEHKHVTWPHSVQIRVGNNTDTNYCILTGLDYATVIRAKRPTTLQNPVNESHKEYFEWKKPDAKECVEENSIPRTHQMKLHSSGMQTYGVEQKEKQEGDHFKR